MRFTIWIGAALLVGVASGTLAADVHLAEGTCEALWPIMAPDGLTLSEDNVGPFIVDFTKIDTNKDGLIDAAEFQVGCRAGLVKPPQPTEPQENAQSNSDPPSPLEPSIWGY
jgi:hypothetical protein